MRRLRKGAAEPKEFEPWELLQMLIDTQSSGMFDGDLLEDIVLALGYGSLKDFFSDNPNLVSLLVDSLYEYVDTKPEWCKSLTETLGIS